MFYPVCLSDFTMNPYHKAIRFNPKTKKQGEIRRIYTEEPEEIDEPYIKANMQVSNPLFIIGIKAYSSNAFCLSMCVHPPFIVSKSSSPYDY